MTKFYPIIFVLILSGCGAQPQPRHSDSSESERAEVFDVISETTSLEVKVEDVGSAVDEVAQSMYHHPVGISLQDALSRATKKPFGIEIDSRTSPVQPERFSGFHTGVDFEVREDELSQDIDVYAFCDGEIVEARSVGGYGGVILQSCMVGEEKVSALYGHVSLDDLAVRVGQVVSAGTKISELGDHLSSETAGERKHLHFGLSALADLRGYVQDERLVSGWIDPIPLLQLNQEL